MIDRPDTDKYEYETNLDDRVRRLDLQGELEKHIRTIEIAMIEKGERAISFSMEDDDPRRVGVLFAAVKNFIETNHPDLHVQASSWPKKDRTREGSKYQSVISVTAKKFKF